MGVTTLHSFMAILAVLEISIEEREREDNNNGNNNVGQ